MCFYFLLKKSIRASLFSILKISKRGCVFLNTAENLSLSQNRKSAQKGAKRRLHGGKRRSHGGKRRSHGAKRRQMRILAPFGAFWRNGKKHSVFQFFIIFIKRIKKYAFVH